MYSTSILINVSLSVQRMPLADTLCLPAAQRKQATALVVMMDEHVDSILVPISGCDLITCKNKCFSYFSHSSINRNDARVNCQTWGGDLASIASAGENAAVDSIRSSSADGFCWIGLNDFDTEGTFVWSDGSGSSYRNWAVGQPNNFNDEDCAFVLPIFWDDLPCSHTLPCYYCSILIGKSPAK